MAISNLGEVPSIVEWWDAENVTTTGSVVEAMIGQEGVVDLDNPNSYGSDTILITNYTSAGKPGVDFSSTTDAKLLGNTGTVFTTEFTIGGVIGVEDNTVSSFVLLTELGDLNGLEHDAGALSWTVDYTYVVAGPSGLIDGDIVEFLLHRTGTTSTFYWRVNGGPIQSHSEVGASDEPVGDFHSGTNDPSGHVIVSLFLASEALDASARTDVFDHFSSYYLGVAVPSPSTGRVRLSPQIEINKDWNGFKKILKSKQMRLQWEETDIAYEILAVDGPIVYSTRVYTGTVPAGSGVEQATNDLNKADFEDVYKDISNRPLQIVDRLSVLSLGDTISATEYGLVVDLDNAGATGPYRHVGSSGVRMAVSISTLTKSDASDQWTIEFGVVLSINATDTTIAWVESGFVDLTNQAEISKQVNLNLLPAYLDLVVIGGKLPRVVSTDVETTTDINTTTPLPDASGVNRTLAPGDLISRTTLVSGTGTLSSSTLIWYFVE